MINITNSIKTLGDVCKKLDSIEKYLMETAGAVGRKVEAMHWNDAIAQEFKAVMQDVSKEVKKPIATLGDSKRKVKKLIGIIQGIQSIHF